jgi:hypothetical protein
MMKVQLWEFLAILVTPAVAVAQPASAPDDIAELQRAERRQVEQAAAELRVVECDDIRRLVRFAIEEDVLTARTQLSSTDDEVRIVAPQLRGVARLRVIGMGQDEPGRNFNFIVDDVSTAAPGRAITTVSALSGRLILARDSETAGVMSSIQLIQDPPGLADPSGVEPPVRLFVKITYDAGAGQDVDLKLTSGTFSELRRKHPRELNRYLRPILRDFAQEQAVFGTDARAQWQVLAADRAGDVALAAKIRTVLSKFDSDDYQDRVRAADELGALGQDGALELSGMDRSKFSPEQSSAVDAFLAPYLPLLAADVERLRQSPEFLLDCLYSDDAMMRKLALVRLREVTGKAIPAELAGDSDARVAQIERLRGLISPSPASQDK